MRSLQLGSTTQSDTHATDSMLMLRIRQRDVQALEHLYDRYSMLLYALALRTLGDRAVAEEIVIDLFSALWQSADSFSASENVASALLAATWQRIQPALNAHSNHRFVDVAALDHHQTFLSSVSQYNHADRVAKGSTIRRLPPEQREIIELAYYDRLTIAEIAVRLEISLSAVKMNLRQGLLALHKSTFLNGDRQQ